MDTRTDIALLKVETGKPIVPIRTTDTPLQAGEWVAAIGSPFGFDNTITAGIVSAPRGIFPMTIICRSFKQMWPSIPVIRVVPLQYVRSCRWHEYPNLYSKRRLRGDVLLYSHSEALRIAEQLKSRAKLERSRIGVRIEALSHDLAKALGVPFQDGVAVLYVEPRSPADVAGMRPGDIITSVENKPIQSAQEITKHVSDSQPNTRLKFHVLRMARQKKTSRLLYRKSKTWQVCHRPSPYHSHCSYRSPGLCAFGR